jgi:RsiW-degrading membrane proteinase PrsW (M82 family)
MVLTILAIGVMLGYIVEHFTWVVSESPNIFSDGSRQLEKLASEDQWWQLWWAIPGIDFPRRFSTMGPVFLAGWAGFLWLVFSLQAVQIRGPRDLRLRALLIAVGLGVLSVWPTHFFHYWQEYRWHLLPSEQLGPGLRYYVLGVGLCEELAKLLCLLPLLLALLRKHDELLALMASACVGLGFAMAENAGYFLGSGGSDLVGRFLTANPTHMTLTGLIGLAAYRGMHQPRQWGLPALALFGVMVFVHGLYDASIALPALAEYALLGTILFIAVVYQFFHELRALRPKRVEMISLTANFLAGVSLAAAVTFVYLSATVGCMEAWEVLAPGGLGLSLMVYLFLREMPETLVSV